MAMVKWRHGPLPYTFTDADENSPPVASAVVIEDLRVTFTTIFADEVNINPSGDLNAGAIKADQDAELTTQGDGYIVKDKTTGTRYRILVDNGVLKKEAV